MNRDSLAVCTPGFRDFSSSPAQNPNSVNPTGPAQHRPNRKFRLTRTASVSKRKEHLDQSPLVAKGRPTRALGVPVDRINTTPSGRTNPDLVGFGSFP